MYDIVIDQPGDWDELIRRRLDVIIDPFVLRSGQLFLQGMAGGAPDRWAAIEADLGALVKFFDIAVLYDQIPAFNYNDTFDFPNGQMWNDYNLGLKPLLNAQGDTFLLNVDVEHHMYRAVKERALPQIGELLDRRGELVPADVRSQVVETLQAVQYEWQPNLEALEPRLRDPDDQKVARFLLGQLVFSGYAQQTGAPLVVAPRRSLLVAAAGLGGAAAPASDKEAAIYDELRRRVRDAGVGWRVAELPWTPSFLPYLLSTVNPYREGPDVLLRRAKELRETRAVRRYREMRRDLMSADAAHSDAARCDLSKAADDVADELHASRQTLEVSHSFAVDALPEAVGGVIGLAAGGMLAGPVGAYAGTAAGPLAGWAVKQLNQLLWGWALDELPFRSARKLLSQAVRQEMALKNDLGPRLRTVWETARA